MRPRRPRGRRWGAVGVSGEMDGAEGEMEERWRRARCLVSWASSGKMPRSRWKKRKKEVWRLLIVLTFRVDCSCRGCLDWVENTLWKGNRWQRFDWLQVIVSETILDCMKLFISARPADLFSTLWSLSSPIFFFKNPFLSCYFFQFPLFCSARYLSQSSRVPLKTSISPSGSLSSSFLFLPAFSCQGEVAVAACWLPEEQTCLCLSAL